MTQKNFNTIQNLSYETLAESLLWAQLTDFQKAKIHQGNARLADQIDFEDEYISFEQPEKNFTKTKNNQA